MTTHRPIGHLCPFSELLAGLACGVGLALGLLALLAALAASSPQSPAAPTSPVAQLARPDESGWSPPAALRVVELRKVARAQLGSSTRIDGRRIAQATRGQLLSALEAA